MELEPMPLNGAPESEAFPNLEEQEFDRIAFELWQRGSLPELAEDGQAEVEEVACHASCL